MLNSEQKRRYARHIVLPQIGEEGQSKLSSARVIVVGAGGLGASCLMSLAASGIGHIAIVEPDHVELSNLPRQTLYETADIGSSKAKAAKERLQEMNPEIIVELHSTRLDANNVDSLIKEYNLVIDCTDNFVTRYVINDACIRGGISWIHAAILGFVGHVASFSAKPDAPCYRCYVPQIPEREISCAQEGIISPIAGIVGNIQALQAIKILLGIGEELYGKLLIIDSLTMKFRKVKLSRDEQCIHNHLYS